MKKSCSICNPHAWVDVSDFDVGCETCGRPDKNSSINSRVPDGYYRDNRHQVCGCGQVHGRVEIVLRDQLHGELDREGGWVAFFADTPIAEPAKKA